MLAISFASFITVSYQENFYVVNDTSFSARDFTKEHIPAGAKIEGGMFPADFENLYDDVQGDMRASSIIIIDIHTEIWRIQWEGEEHYEVLRNETREMELIYINGEYTEFFQSDV